MKVYLGVDIGTTNTKFLVLGSNGVIIRTMKQITPKKIAGKVEYLDIRKLQRTIDEVITGISEEYSIQGIAFSSIGETVIPVSNRKPLCEPLMWYDRASYPYWEKHRDTVESLAPYRITGIENGYIFSIYKIIFQKHFFELDHVEHWLPVGAYFAYMFGAEATWDMSLACRSLMVDVHKRKWNEQLVEYTGESPDSMGALVYTGQLIGETRDGVPIVSGGHDHITGLYAAMAFAGNREFLLDSMGSAAVVASVVNANERQLQLEEPFMPGGTIGIAFEESQYYIENDVRYYGRFLETLMRLTGFEPNREGFRKVNQLLEERNDWEFDPLFLVSGDLFTGEAMKGITILDIPLDTTREQLVKSAYVYLASSSKTVVDKLERIAGRALPIIAGGGGSQNELLMRYKASLLNRDIAVLQTSELTALGAALAAARGVGDTEVVSSCVGNHELLKTSPDHNLSEIINRIHSESLRRYAGIQKEKKIDLSQGGL